MINDYDDSPARWSVSYDSNGKRQYAINDGRTGSNAVAYNKNPNWFGNSYEANVYDKLNRYITAPSGYRTDTETINNPQTVGTYNRHVGYQDKYSYNWSTSSPSGGVWLHKDNNYSSTRTGYGVGDHAYVGDDFNDQTSLLDLQSDTRVIVYEHRDFGGSSAEYYNDISYAAGDWWNDKISSLRVYGKQWYGANVYENQYDYNYDWTSKWANVTDDRLTTKYQWVSNPQDIYDNRPRYETFDTLVKDVSYLTKTNFRTEEVLEPQLFWTTERLNGGGNQAFGDFANDAIRAGANLNLNVGGNATISAKLNTVGASGAININASGAIALKGELPEGTTTNNTIAAPAVLNTQNRITLNGNQVTVSDRSEVTASQSNAEIIISSKTDLNFSGVALTGNGSNGKVSLKSATDVTLTGEVRSNDIDVQAGLVGGVGNLTGDVNTYLDAGNSGSIDLNAGANSGNINLPSAWVKGGTVNLIANNGSINNYKTSTNSSGQTQIEHGLIAANNLTLTANAGVTANVIAEQLTVDGSSLDLNVSPHTTTTTANLTATTGDLYLTALGSLKLQKATTPGNLNINSARDLNAGILSAGNSLQLDVLDGNFILNNQLSAGTKASLNIQGNAVSLNNSSVNSPSLELVITGGANLNTATSNLSVLGMGEADIILNNTSSNLQINGDVLVQGGFNLKTTGNLSLDKIKQQSDTTETNALIRLQSGGAISLTGIDAGVNYGIIELDAVGNITILNPNDNQADLLAKTIKLNSGDRLSNLEINTAELEAIVAKGNVQVNNFVPDLNMPRALNVSRVEAPQGNIYITTPQDLVTTAQLEVSPSGDIKLVSKLGDLLINPSANNQDKLLKAYNLSLNALDRLIVNDLVKLEANSLEMIYGDTGITSGAIQLPNIQASNLTLELGSGSVIVTPDSFVNPQTGVPYQLNQIELTAYGNLITEGKFTGYYRYRDIYTNKTYYQQEPEANTGEIVYQEVNGVLSPLRPVQVELLKLVPVLEMLSYQERETESGKYIYLGNDGRQYYKDTPNGNDIYTRQRSDGQYAYTVRTRDPIPTYLTVYSPESNPSNFAQQNTQYQDVQINFQKVSNPSTLNLQAKMLQELAGGIQQGQPVGKPKTPVDSLIINANTINLSAARDIKDINLSNLQGNAIALYTGADLTLTSALQTNNLTLTSNGYFDNLGNFVGGNITTGGNFKLANTNLEVNAFKTINLNTAATTVSTQIAGKGEITIENASPISNVTVQDLPDLKTTNAPKDVVFETGLLGFKIPNISHRSPQTVTLTLPTDVTTNSYWMYGATPDNNTNHWYEFWYDGKTGARFFDDNRDKKYDRVVLTLIDGQRGDTDLTANGTIIDPGTLAFATNNSVIEGTSTRDFLYGKEGNDRINGGAGNDYLYGGDGFDELYGGDDNDYLSGGAGLDYLYGEAGSDRLEGDQDNDYLDAADGNDSLTGGAGADTIIGGLGTDILEYINSSAKVNVNLTTGAASGGDAQGDIISGLEQVRGSAGGDTIVGDAQINIVYGRDGNDLLSGGANRDSLYGDNQNDILIGGSDRDDLYGGDGDDLLIGTDPNATTPGLGDIDILQGQLGLDTYVLGANGRVFYNDGNNSSNGKTDYARIVGFKNTEDVIELLNNNNTYYQAVSPTATISGTGIYLDNDGVTGFSVNDELLAILQSVTPPAQPQKIVDGTVGYRLKNEQ